MSTPNDPSWEAYGAAVARYLASIDSVLAAGDRAQARMADFYRRHGIEPGSGERALTSPSLSAAEREANRQLLARREALAAAAQGAAPTPVVQPTSDTTRCSPSVAARALGNRTLI